MKLWKKILAMLCIVALVLEIGYSSHLTAHAEEESFETNETAAEESQSEEMPVDIVEAVAVAEETSSQQPETLAETTAQTEPGTAAESKRTEASTITVPEASEETDKTQNSAETKETGEQNLSENQTADTEETESNETEEEFIRTMEYEDDDVKVHVTAVTKDAIPESATLKVVPIVERIPSAGMSEEEIAEINNINNQYKEVEKKLTEKAENEAYDIAGFLAYDISFVDKDGNKVEPNGEVKVSMDYKKAVIPEEAAKANAEITDVTVMHFEEDANGQVKEIVDMVADESKEATVQTTTNAEVKKTEFVTDSFSTFTLAWKETKETVTVHRVDTNGNEIGTDVDGPDSYKNGFSVSLQGLAESEWYSVGGYTFLEGYIINDGKTVLVSQISYSAKKGWQYKRNDKDDWRNWKTDSREVYLVYERTEVIVHLVDKNGEELTDSPETASLSGETSLSTLAGQYSVEGYAFSRGCLDTYTGTQFTSIRKQKSGWQYQDRADSEWKNWRSDEKHVYLIYKKVETLNTVPTVDSTALGVTMRMVDFKERQTNIGGGYELNKGRTAGLLTSTVQDNGYPKSTQEGVDVDFEDWFRENATGDNINSENTMPVNHLFLKSVYDETGYFSYSSFDNYAYLNKDGNFTVYDAIGTPTDGNGTSGQYFYQRGNFMPYNNIVADKFSKNDNMYSPDGVALTTADQDYGRDLYLSQGNNFNFGMYIEAQFAQAKDGIYKGSPMRFNFNGDDDLWVYIDGVLVLDIGGIHDAQSGYIDFRTGEVHVTALSSGTGTDTTIKEMFEFANQNTSIGFEGNTFSDYSAHKIQIFYMERGEGASNLQISFNLPVIPEGTVEVGKELSNTDKEKYANVEFAFQLWAQKESGTDEQGNKVFSNEYEPIGGAVYKDTTTEVEFKPATINGKEYANVFYLKPGERAQFTGLQANRKYYVKEIGVKSEEYDKIIINGTEYTEFNEEQQESGHVADIKTPEEMVSKRPLVVFTNNCSGANNNELHIIKKMADNAPVDDNDTFTFKVELENQNGELTSYVGDYYLLDLTGNYYYYDDNNTLVNNHSEAKVCGATADGCISGIPVGYKIVITGLLSGTDFKVTEVNLDTHKYIAEYGKTLEEGTYAPADIEGADGQIKLNGDAKVTITNDRYRNIHVSKNWTDGTHTTGTVYAGLYEVKGANTEPVPEKYVKLSYSGNPDDSWQGDFDGLGYNKTYEVKELRPVTTGETEDFIIDGQQYVAVEANDIIRVDNIEYKAIYDNPDPTHVSITNSRLSILKIDKVKADDHSIKLGGAKFKLQKQVNGTFEDVMNGDQPYIVTTDTNGNAVFEHLEEGTYQIIEIEAPTGYTLMQKPIQITLAYEKLQDQDDDSITVNEDSKVTIGEKNVYYEVTQTVENVIIYKLPSAGGLGIYWYTIGGTLFMMAAALILYRSKRRGRC